MIVHGHRRNHGAPDLHGQHGLHWPRGLHDPHDLHGPKHHRHRHRHLGPNRHRYHFHGHHTPRCEVDPGHQLICISTTPIHTTLTLPYTRRQIRPVLHQTRIYTTRKLLVLKSRLSCPLVLMDSEREEDEEVLGVAALDLAGSGVDMGFVNTTLPLSHRDHNLVDITHSRTWVPTVRSNERPPLPLHLNHSGPHPRHYHDHHRGRRGCHDIASSRPNQMLTSKTTTVKVENQEAEPAPVA